MSKLGLQGLACAPVLLLVRGAQAATKAADSAVGNVSAACDRAIPKLSLPTKASPPPPPHPHPHTRRCVCDRTVLSDATLFVVLLLLLLLLLVVVVVAVLLWDLVGN